MPDSPQSCYPSDTFADIFFGWNPFPPDDPRHGLWETNARYAVEERDRLKAELLKRLPAEGAATHEWLCWMLDCTGGAFDIVAHRLLIFIVGGPESAGLYRALLGRLVEHYFTATLQNCPSFIPESLLRSELRIRLEQREAHYRVEALELVRESQKSASVSDSEKPESWKSTIGSNIDRLRKECGWSFNDLANETGLEKKLILGHVNKGKGLQPKTLRIYAQAFSLQLGRAVSVAELESATK